MADNLTIVPDSGSGGQTVVVTPVPQKGRSDSVTTIITGTTSAGATAMLRVVQKPADKYVKIDGLYDQVHHKAERIPAAGGNFRLIGYSNCNGLSLSHMIWRNGDTPVTNFDIGQFTIYPSDGDEGVSETIGRPFETDWGARAEYRFEYALIIQPQSSQYRKSVYVFQATDLNREVVASLNIEQS